MLEFTWSSFLWCIVVPLTSLLLLQSKKKRSTKQRPPGPPGWPVLGNMFDLGTMPHQTLYSLRSKYGPVLWLQLGSINTMVVQSGKAATELFKNHDLSFCDRKCPGVLTALDYNQGSLAVAQYGAYWRMLRKICSVELLGTKRINDMAPLRRKWVDNMIRWIEKDAAASLARGESGESVNVDSINNLWAAVNFLKVIPMYPMQQGTNTMIIVSWEVDMPHFLFLMAFNLVGNVMLSRDLLDFESEKGHEFYNAMNKLTEYAGTPNMADFLPFLKWLDPQGIQKNFVQAMGQAMNIVSEFVKERSEEQKSQKEKERDFLDALLEYEGDGREGPTKMSDKNINIIILEMFVAGSETTSSSIEWGLTELLRSPESMRKAKEELDRVIGSKRKVEESDIDELPYLQAVVKETLRLHPAIPLLLPRNTMQDTNYMGYLIPKNTQVFVNAWAIGKDPDCWEDPLSFKPERFLGSNIDYKGQNFELIPFGSGRRICVGISLAQKLLHLALASLLHTFDWELGSNVTPETIDMKERTGITLRKLVPLKAIPKRRIA